MTMRIPTTDKALNPNPETKNALERTLLEHLHDDKGEVYADDVRCRSSRVV